MSPHAPRGTLKSLPEPTVALLERLCRSEIALRPPAPLLGGGSFVRVVQLLDRAIGEPLPVFRVWSKGS